MPRLLYRARSRPLVLIFTVGARKFPWEPSGWIMSHGHITIDHLTYFRLTSDYRLARLPYFISGMGASRNGVTSSATVGEERIL